MTAAKAAGRRRAWTAAAGVSAPEAGKATNLMMRSAGKGRAELVDDAGQGKRLDKTRLYGTVECQSML